MAFPNVNSKNNLNISCANLNSSNNTVGLQQKVDDINLVQKPKLTPEQKQEMILLGLAPENDADVQKYLTMTPEMKNAQIKQFESNNQPTIVTSPVAQNTEETSSVVLPDAVVEQNGADTELQILPEPPVEQKMAESSKPDSFMDRVHEEIQNLGIDTNSDEWKAKSDEEKMNAVLLAGAKSKFTEEEWDGLTKEQKIAAGKEFAKSEISKFIPDWDTYSDEKKLEVLSDYANMALIAKNKKMKLSELLDLKTQDPEKFENIAKSYYKNNTPIDLLSKGKEIIYEKINSSEKKHNDEFEAYLNSKGFRQSDLSIPGKNRHEREFLEQEIKSNKKLTKFQELRYEELNTRHKFHEYCKKNNYKYDVQNPKPGDLQYRLEYYRELIKKEPDNEHLRSELSTLEKLASINGGNLENMTAGELEINDIDCSFPTQHNLAKLSVVEQNKVYDRIAEYLIENRDYENLSEEEQVKLIQQFNSSSQVILLRALDRRGMSAKGTLNNIDALIRLDAMRPNSSKVLQDSSVEALGEQIKYLKDHNLSTDGFTEYMENDLFQRFDKPHAQQAGLKSWEHGEKFGASANKGIAKREDAPEVFEGLNDLIYNSDTISDELKELYAQTSVEYLSPEYRDAQAERLRSYGSESFNKGVDTGYENVRTGNTSSNNSSNSVNNSASSNNSANTVNANNTFEETLRNLDISKSEDAQQLVNLVESNSVEVTKYLNSCSGQERNAFIEKYCKVADKSQILAFIKQNPSMYATVLKYANNLDKEAVFRAIYKGNKSEIPELVKNLELDAVKLANTYKEIAPDIAVTLEHSELARAILLNPAQWNYNLGSSDTAKLNQIASQEQIKDATESVADTNPKTARTLMKEFDPMYLGKDGVVWA